MRYCCRFGRCIRRVRGDSWPHHQPQTFAAAEEFEQETGTENLDHIARRGAEILKDSKPLLRETRNLGCLLGDDDDSNCGDDDHDVCRSISHGGQYRSAAS